MERTHHRIWIWLAAALAMALLVLALILVNYYEYRLGNPSKSGLMLVNIQAAGGWRR